MNANPPDQTRKEIFSNCTVYVEIFNNCIDQSEILYEILEQNGAKVTKKLGKGVQFIIFKEGKNKTVEYAIDNSIALVNPLWVHDSVTQGTIATPERYRVKKTYADIQLENATKQKKKRSVSKSPDNSKRGKKKKSEHTKGEADLIINTEEIIECNRSLDNQLSANSKKSDFLKEEKGEGNTRITNFFQSVTAIKKKVEINIPVSLVTIPLSTTSIQPLLKVSSIGLNEFHKCKILSYFHSFGNYKYIGEDFQGIKTSEFVLVPQNVQLLRNQIKYLYCILNEKKLYPAKYFFDTPAEKFSKEDLEKSIHTYPVNIHKLEEAKENAPLMKDKYQIYIHPSVYEKTNLILEVLTAIIKILSGDSSNACTITDNIRLSDICIINTVDTKAHFPGHVTLLNQDFLIDSFYNFKLMDINDRKYFPKQISKK